MPQHDESTSALADDRPPAQSVPISGQSDRPGQSGEQRLGIALKNAPVRVYRQDRQLVYTWAYNPGSQLPADTIVGQTDEQLYPKAEARGLAAIKRRVLESKSAAREEIALTMDGDRRIVDLTVEPLYATNGALNGVTSVAIDVTDYRRLQEDFLHAQKMEAMGRVASGVAHDFRNLLMGIIGCCDLARGQVDASSPVLPFLEEIGAVAQKGAALTRQLLTFSRKQAVGKRAVDLNDLLERSQNMLRRVLGADVQLRLEQDASRPIVMGDPGQLEQIIMNLVVNARDAMADGGTLTLGTENRIVHGENGVKASCVVLVVSDTGCGMSAEVQARAIEPFFTTKSEAEGTGLGLSSAYGIVRQHGGTLAIESAEGRGTTVRLSFPCSEHLDAVDEQAARLALEAARRATVLVVEDERLVRMTVRHYLEDLGYTVLEASRPSKALKSSQLYDGTIDLLLTDIVLPEMSGRELAREIYPQHPGMQVLYMSAYPYDVLVRQGRLEPGTLTLEKPFTKEALAARLRQALNIGPA